MFPWQIKEPGLQKGLERAPAAASPTMTPQWDGVGTPSLPEGSAQLKESPALKGPIGWNGHPWRCSKSPQIQWVNAGPPLPLQILL